MNINWRQLLIILIVAIAVFLFFYTFVGRAYAQEEATPVPGAPPEPDAFDDASPADSDNPAWDAILAYSGMVAGFVGTVTPLLTRYRIRETLPDGTHLWRWGDEVHDFIVRLIAILAALAIIFLTRSQANVLEVLGIVVDVPLWVAQFLTALAIGFGSSFLWSIFKLFKNVPQGRTIVLMNQPEGNTTITPPR